MRTQPVQNTPPMSALISSLIRRTLALALSVSISCASPVSAAEAAASAPVIGEAPALFQRIVLLGASVTAGFEITEPLGGPKTPQYRFAHYIESALAGTHAPVETQASALLFLKADETMERQTAAVLAAEPTLVIGIDALFWFCYGEAPTAEQRLARFDAGLRFLDRIAAPMVLGDIPDATSAVGGILNKAELPDPTVIARCNERLKAWAAGRRNVVLIPIGRMMTAASANAELTLAGTTWAEGKSRALIRSDRLHPSRHGLAALAIATLDAAVDLATPPPGKDALCREVETVYNRAVVRGGGVPKLAK